MGPSGSGKTVLLKHLIGLEEPDAGEILIDGESIQSPEVMADYRMAMVFQSGALLNSLTVGENVGLYLTEHRLKPPEEIARIVAGETRSRRAQGHRGQDAQRTLRRHEETRGHRPRAGHRAATDPLRRADQRTGPAFSRRRRRGNRAAQRSASRSPPSSSRTTATWPLASPTASPSSTKAASWPSARRSEVRRHPDPLVQTFLNAEL